MSREGQRHLVLIGLMGAGKSTVGALCAERLGRPFIDTDELVQVISGRDFDEIWSNGGEPAFRELERQAVADACASPDPLVIACGGGAVLDAENRRQLRTAGVVVWLRAPASELAARVRGQGHVRPLLADGDAETELERLGELRAAAYEGAAHAAVDTEGHTIEATVDAVLAEVARCTV